MRAFALGLSASLLPLAWGCATPPTPSAADAPSALHEARPAPWRPVEATTGVIRDVGGLTALAEAFPESGSVRLRLLNAQLQASDFAGVLATLEWLQARGYVFSKGARGQIPRLVGEDRAADAKALLLPDAGPMEASAVAWTIPSAAGLIESLVVDEEPGRMVASSVTERAIWGTTPRGEWKAVAPPNADNLSGMVGDKETSILWVASGNVDGSHDEEAYFSGLIGISDPPQVLRIPAPEGVVLSDLHLAEDGTIFASDPLNGGVYMVGPLREEFEVVVPPGTLRSPQGLTTSVDGSILYVNDYRYGIAIIELSSGRVARLSPRMPLIMDGGDALFRHGNALISIQNGTSPMRISRFDLSSDGQSVVGHSILEQAHTSWSEPLGGALVGNALYYVANGQWDKYVAGVLAEGKTPDPVVIRRLPLD